MDILFVAFPAALALGALFLGAFLWATRKGQFEDLDTPSIRMLHEERPISGSDVAFRATDAPAEERAAGTSDRA